MLDGVLREFGTFDENGLVCIPDHFSFEEAATLPCAAVTAYHALFESGRMKSDDSILLQGTGGVSIFALQIAAALGTRIIITSSSDEKLEKAKELGATDFINYRTREDWDKAVLELTEKRGVDHIVEVGGAGTIAKSLKAVKVGRTYCRHRRIVRGGGRRHQSGQCLDEIGSNAGHFCRFAPDVRRYEPDVLRNTFTSSR